MRDAWVGLLLYHGLVPTESKAFRRGGHWWVEGQLLPRRAAPSHPRLSVSRHVYRVMLSASVETPKAEAISGEWAFLVQRERSLLEFPLPPREKEKCLRNLLYLGVPVEITDAQDTHDLLYLLYWHDRKGAMEVMLQGLERSLSFVDPEKYRSVLVELQKGAVVFPEDQTHALDIAFGCFALLNADSGLPGSQKAWVFAAALSHATQADLLRDLLRERLLTP